MKNYFEKVKNYLLELEYDISYEDANDQVLGVDKEESGIKNLFIACAEPILIMEQVLFEMNNENISIFKKLLQKNRELVHGAFVLDPSSLKVIFRDTLEIKNLDINELEASLNALRLLLTENSSELIHFSKQ